MCGFAHGSMERAVERASEREYYAICFEISQYTFHPFDKNINREDALHHLIINVETPSKCTKLYVCWSKTITSTRVCLSSGTRARSTGVHCSGTIDWVLRISATFHIGGAERQRRLLVNRRTVESTPHFDNETTIRPHDYVRSLEFITVTGTYSKTHISPLQLDVS